MGIVFVGMFLTFPVKVYFRFFCTSNLLRSPSVSILKLSTLTLLSGLSIIEPSTAACVVSVLLLILSDIFSINEKSLTLSDVSGIKSVSEAILIFLRSALLNPCASLFIIESTFIVANSSVNLTPSLVVDMDGIGKASKPGLMITSLCIDSENLLHEHKTSRASVTRIWGVDTLNFIGIILPVVFYKYSKLYPHYQCCLPVLLKRYSGFYC